MTGAIIHRFCNELADDSAEGTVEYIQKAHRKRSALKQTF